MSKLMTGLMLCAGVAFSTSSGAAAMAKDAYNAELDRIKTEYKADRERCS